MERSRWELLNEELAAHRILINILRILVQCAIVVQHVFLSVAYGCVKVIMSYRNIKILNAFRS